MHMFNMSTLCIQSTKLLHQKLWQELIGPSRYILCIYKSHKESQREITLIELVPSPYSFAIGICPVNMNMYARFDEILSMTL